MDTKRLFRIPRLIIGVITLLFAGIIYAWSILKAPLAAEFGWTAANLALNFTIMMCFFCLGGLISGLLAKKTAPQLRMIVGAALVFAGFFITSRLSGESLVPLYLGYGVLAGTGIGVVYNTVIAVTGAWFPDKKGICSGSLMMGFGFSTLVLGNVAGIMIDTASIGWRNTYLILGIAIGAVILLAGLFTKLPAPGTNLPQPKQVSKKAAGEASEYSAGEMIRRLSFYKIFLFFMLLSSVGNAAISFAKDYTISIGATPAFAVTLVGIVSVSNGLGRLCSGALFDTLGLRRTQIITSVVAILAPAVALLGTFTDVLALGVIGLCLCGFCYGFSPTMSAAISGAFFGQRNFALNFSILNLTLIPASFTATLAGNLITATGSYIPVFAILVGFSVVGLIINLTIRKA